MADATGVEGDVSRSVDDLAEHLANRQVLLLLDNCEHVLEQAATLVDRMLERGQAARILATSREPLHLAGEHVWPLGPLGPAGPALFVERAQAAEPRVRWDASDPRVIDLCRRLDNVPLALELAAGQLRRFDLDELARRFDRRRGLPARRGSEGSDRHATIEATIDWSYQLLDAAEQELLRHLSAFPASFDLEAVEASAPPSLTVEADVLLGELVDKSLVVREPGTGRYRLLETIRAFARHRLGEAGEEQDAVERHRRHVRDRVGSTSRLDRWLSARLAAAYRADFENARQAFWISIDNGCISDAVEIAVGAAFLWRQALGCSEGNGWVEKLLDEDLNDRDRLWVEILRADVGQGRGDSAQMFDAGETAHRIASRAEVTDLEGACLAAHYRALERLTDPRRAKDRLTPALELARMSRDLRLVTLIETFVVVSDLAAGEHETAQVRLLGLDSSASEDGYDRFILHWAGWLLGLAETDAAAGPPLDGQAAHVPRSHRDRRDLDHLVLDRDVRSPRGR